MSWRDVRFIPVVAVVGAIVGVVPLASSSSDAERTKERMAAGLADEGPAGAFGAPHTFDPRSGARAAAQGRSKAIPLPDGGNFNGIRWELAAGGVPSGDIETVLEYNAACQWLRALEDGREAGVAEEVLASVPKWPSLRDTESSALIGRAAEEIVDGGGSTATALLADCAATHAREVAYAKTTGRVAST